MASYLQIENISKSYGLKVLFDRISFNVNEGDKIALIAPNGAGKTSLMRILAGKDSSDSGGKVLFLKDIRIAFLEQDFDFDPQNTISQQIGDSLRTREILTSLGLVSGDRLMGELSGGEVKRVAITQMLASEADFFIMDEPTNHLDVDAIEFLESYLSRSRCTLLMVTHDRYFLDRVCNTVMELDRGAIYTYRGNYQNYLEKRQERISNYNAQTDKVRNLLRRELEWIHATPCARSGKAKYRKDAFRELQERAGQARVETNVSMDEVKYAARLGTKVINCKDLYCEYPGWPCIVRDFTYNFSRGEKVGIVGRNGIGKSTFINLLMGVVSPQAVVRGSIERGSSLQIGYYRQDGMSFKEDDTVLDVVPDMHLLGRFLFTPDMYGTRVSRLSGGERRRLYLLTILMKQPNMLVLDEPTNDLDIVTLNVLEEYLLDFSGTLIIVSHDRHFMDRLVDHLLVFCGDGVVKDFIGNFSEYRAFIKDYEAEARRSAKATAAPARTAKAPAARTRSSASASQPSSSLSGASPSAAPPKARPRRLTYKEQRELEALEAEIAALTAERANLETQLSSGTLAYDALQAASARIGQIMALLDEKELRWLELSEFAS